MVLKSIIGATCACLAVVSFNVDAVVLESRLGGLAYYDPDANLTWLADANYAKTSGHDSDGRMTWEAAKSWAFALSIGGAEDWRLPDTLDPDASCSDAGHCTGSEMGNLFYNVLGGIADSSITTAHNANYTLFSNIQSDIYWSATESNFRTQAWHFVMIDGTQGIFFQSHEDYAWAVHSGDIGAVPIPSAVWLFGSGLMVLVGLVRRKS